MSCSAIFGKGISGQALAALLEKKGQSYRFFDEKEPKDTVDLVNFLTNEAKQVLYSPGFRPNHPWLLKAQALNIPCYGELDFSLKHHPEALLWAVTGTNGKSTLTAFLAHALNHLGQKAQAVGNIGYPMAQFCVDFTENQNPIAVCEISSAQAASLQQFNAKHIFWTNLAPDHLDWHGSFEAYVQAKAKLLALSPQTPVWATESVFDFSQNIKAQLVASWPIPPANSVFSQAPYTRLYHLAAAAWQHEGFPIEALAAAAQSFTPLPHRLSWVRTLQNVSFWNDSKGTNTHAAQAALQAFPQKALFWIGGGADKNEPLEPFCQILKSTITHAFLIGQTAQAFQKLLGPECSSTYSALTQATQAAAQAALAHAAPAVVLLSPACASKDQFNDYAHRGQVFIEEVERLRG